METGAPLPKQTPSQIPSDYVQCEFCQRHFNKHAAERHIPLYEFCLFSIEMFHLFLN